MRFDQHTVVLLVRPSDAPELPAEAEARLRETHLAHQAGLVEQGLLLAAGPLVDPDDDRLRGFCVLGVEPQAARHLFHDDPAVRAGQLEARVATWMVPEGNVRYGDVAMPRSLLEAAAGD